MDGSITVRFLETQSYDISKDCEVVRLMATTSLGTYYADVELESPKTLREMRKSFKEAAIEMIQSGQQPCEMELG